MRGGIIAGHTMRPTPRFMEMNNRRKLREHDERYQRHLWGLGPPPQRIPTPPPSPVSPKPPGSPQSAGLRQRRQPEETRDILEDALEELTDAAECRSRANRQRALDEQLAERRTGYRNRYRREVFMNAAKFVLFTAVLILAIVTGVLNVYFMRHRCD